MIRDRIEQLNIELKEHKSRIKEILKEHGYNYTPNKFEDLISVLNEMYILNPNKTHKLAITTEEGYVLTIREFKTSEVYEGYIPEDLDMHYYKLIDGKLIVDEKLKEDLLSLD